MLAAVGEVEEVVEEGGVGFTGLLESQLPGPLMIMLVWASSWDVVVSRMGIMIDCGRC